MNKGVAWALSIFIFSPSIASFAQKQDDRWVFLYSFPNTEVFYDKRTFNSNRESAGGWVRQVQSDGYKDIGLRVDCKGGSLIIFHQREYSPDGKLRNSSDRMEETIIVPGSGEEILRDRLCALRPAWQKVFN